MDHKSGAKVLSMYPSTILPWIRPFPERELIQSENGSICGGDVERAIDKWPMRNSGDSPNMLRRA